MIRLGSYGKTISAVITGAIGWAAVVVNSPAQQITASEWVYGATVLATALGVYVISNAPATVPPVVSVPVQSAPVMPTVVPTLPAPAPVQVLGGVVDGTTAAQLPDPPPSV